MRILIGVAALALPLSVPLPALAQPAAQYEQAVSARLSGDPGRAAEILRALVLSQPDNADAWVQLGYSELALGNLDDAERAFERTLSIAPGYDDAREGLKLVASRRQAVPTRFRLDVDGGYAWTGPGQPDWKEGAVQLRAETGAGKAVTARVEASRRFGKTDVYGEGRVDVDRRGRFYGYFLAGGTPNADFRPEVQLGMGGGARVLQGANPTVATIDMRWAHYPSGTVWTVNPGIEQYLGNGRAWLTARWINLIDDGNYSTGWLARGDVQLDGRLRLFAGLSDAPDTSEGVAIDTFSIFGGAALDIDDRHSVRLSLSNDDPEGSPARTQLSIGAGIRF